MLSRTVVQYLAFGLDINRRQLWVSMLTSWLKRLLGEYHVHVSTCFILFQIDVNIAF